MQSTKTQSIHFGENQTQISSADNQIFLSFIKSKKKY